MTDSLLFISALWGFQYVQPKTLRTLILSCVFMSVFFNLDKNSRSLQGFRGCSCWEEFSHMKEQLDEMNIPSRPGCRFWYSYRHTTGRRLNKRYSSVKNMTSRCSSSAALTSSHHKPGHGPPVCALQHFLLMILPPLPYMGLFLFFFSLIACTHVLFHGSLTR